MFFGLDHTSIPMRFLITPNFANRYDQRMVHGLMKGLREIGHEGTALASPLPGEVMVALATRIDADVVLQVNRFRPAEPALPDRIRHIAWFQDVFPDTGEDAYQSARQGDIVYALGDAEVLGLDAKLPCYVGSLVTGVEPELLDLPRTRPRSRVDFSLCGFIPAPLGFGPNITADLVWYVNDLLDRMPPLRNSWAWRQLRARMISRIVPYGYIPYALATALRAVTEALYHPLCGELDIGMLSAAMYSEAHSFARPKSKLTTKGRHWSRRGRLGRILAPYRTTAVDRNTAIDNFISYLAREYPRLLDRVALIRGALDVSKSLELYGPGWDQHEQFRTYHKGIVADPAGLLPIFQRSRINLANNTHGLGLHSRTLECMAVGGFIFTHRSPHDDKPGGMLTSFEPDVHYGAYTPENFQAEASRWLMDEEGRAKVGAQAAAIIRGKHLWKHRAQQIIDDLKR